jgi:hypothetical protein
VAGLHVGPLCAVLLYHVSPTHPHAPSVTKRSFYVVRICLKCFLLSARPDLRISELLQQGTTPSTRAPGRKDCHYRVSGLGLGLAPSGGTRVLGVSGLGLGLAPSGGTRVLGVSSALIVGDLVASTGKLFSHHVIH